MNHASVAIELAGVEIGLKTAPGAIARFAAPIPQSSPPAGTAAKISATLQTKPINNRSIVWRSRLPINFLDERKLPLVIGYLPILNTSSLSTSSGVT
jgi:hypothetical protein